MFVRITRLRRDGHKIPDHEAGRPEDTTAGDLRSIAGRFELHQPLSSRDAVEVLYDARVLAIRHGVGGMLIRGFEESRGRAVLQEWDATPLDQVLGPNGLLSWNWPKPR